MTSENIIINTIKYFQTEYPDGVPLNILKLELDISVGKLQENLLSLEEQGVLFIENEEYVKLVETSAESPLESPLKDSSGLNQPDDAPGLKVPDEPNLENEMMYDLTEREMKALEIIKNLADDSGHISRHILEGNLLYGDLKFSTLGVYKLIMFLENKGIMRKIQISDSEYYAI